jgi:3-oxoacyl-[acyl-carrier protein] reductase
VTSDSESATASPDTTGAGNVSFDFVGRTAVVTGAARGIGLEIARRFASAGARVFVVDRDHGALEAVARELDVVCLVADVADSVQVEDVVSTVIDATGRLDVLVNNAGLLRDTVLWKMSDDEWEDVLSVHLGGTFRFTRAAASHFRRQHYGRVVNVTSYSGLHGNVGQANYAAAKSGIIGLTKTSAKELARFGVTVNAVSPNAETRMVASIPADKRAELEGAIPLGRFAEAHEMAAAVCFLASEDAGYITGAVVPVDGGLSM